MEFDQVLKFKEVALRMVERANPNERLYFTLEDFDILNECGMIVTFEKGGLLKAPAHSAGGINVLVKKGAIYRVEAEFEGWEFIINAYGTYKHKEDLMNYNNRVTNSPTLFESYNIPMNIRTIEAMPLDFMGVKFPKYLLHPGGEIMILNRQATKFQLELLNNINEASYPNDL